MKTHIPFAALLFALAWWGCPVAPDKAAEIAETPVSEISECTGKGVLGGECVHRCAATCGACACTGHFLGCVCRCATCDEPPTVTLAPDDRLDAVQGVLEESDAEAAAELAAMLAEIRERAPKGDPSLAQAIEAFDQGIAKLDMHTLERLMALAPKE